MRQIEVFVDSVYHSVGGNEEEIQELKTEMKSHLIEAVYDLKSEGKTEQEAIEIAIKRFGGEDELRSIVSQLFQAQKLFAKWVLYISTTFLVLALTVFGALTFISNKNVHEQSVIATHILSKLENSEVVSQEIKDEIKTMVEGTNAIPGVRIYNIKGVNIDGKQFISEILTPTYEFKKEVKDEQNSFFHTFNLGQTFYMGSGDGENHWFVDMSVIVFDNNSILILFVGIAVYWALFSIWAIINAYHQKRLTIGWIIMFILLNFVGVIIYYLTDKNYKKYKLSL
jgi:cytochrome c-type biogenesis protein CcmH/NrfF